MTKPVSRGPLQEWAMWVHACLSETQSLGSCSFSTHGTHPTSYQQHWKTGEGEDSLDVS